MAFGKKRSAVKAEKSTESTSNPAADEQAAVTPPAIEPAAPSPVSAPP